MGYDAFLLPRRRRGRKQYRDGRIFRRGLFLGSLFGYFQWLPLKPCSRRSLEWVPANALGWAAGMVFIFLGASLPNEKRIEH